MTEQPTIEAWPAPQAEQLAYAHVEVNPGHRLRIYLCGGCTDPIGIMCVTCNEPICAITSSNPCNQGAQ